MRTQLNHRHVALPVRTRTGARMHRSIQQRLQLIPLHQGHIVRGGKKPAAFTPLPAARSPARWPEPNPTIKGTTAATMGYKVGCCSGASNGTMKSNTALHSTCEIPRWSLPGPAGNSHRLPAHLHSAAPHRRGPGVQGVQLPLRRWPHVAALVITASTVHSRPTSELTPHSQGVDCPPSCLCLPLAD